jgi:hypothetical protein
MPRWNPPIQEIIDPIHLDADNLISCLPSGTTLVQNDELPTKPPPPVYWRLKRLDASADVLDYWIRSTQQWDLEGIESDLKLCLENS